MTKSIIRNSFLHQSTRKHRKTMKQNAEEEEQDNKSNSCKMIRSCFLYRSPAPQLRLKTSSMPSAGPAGMLMSPLSTCFTMKPASSYMSDTESDHSDDSDCEGDDDDCLEELAKRVRFDNDSISCSKQSEDGGNELSPSNSTTTTVSLDQSSSSIPSIPNLDIANSEEKDHENHHRPLAPAVCHCRRSSAHLKIKRATRRSSSSPSKPFVRPEHIPTPLSSQSLVLAPIPLSPRYKATTKRSHSMVWVPSPSSSIQSEPLPPATISCETWSLKNTARGDSIQKNIARMKFLISSCRKSLQDDDKNNQSPPLSRRHKPLPTRQRRLSSSRSVMTV